MGDGAVLTTWEAGRYANLSASTIKNWVKKGGLKAYKTPGGHYRIRLSDLDRFLVSRGMPLPMAVMQGGKRLLALVPETMKGTLEAIDKWAQRLHVLMVSTGFDAGMALLDFQPQIFLVDLDSPDWDGMAVCRRVLASSKTSAVKVITITSDPTVEKLEKLYSDGVIECFSAPLDPVEFKSFLKRLAPYCGWRGETELQTEKSSL